MSTFPAWFDPKAYFNNKLAATPGYNDLTLTAAFNNAGFGGDEGLWNHYLIHGQSEGISPNSYFDVQQYLFAKAAEYLNVATVTQTQADYLFKLIEEAGMTPWEHYQQHGWSEGLNPSNGFDSQKYLDAKLAQLVDAEPDAAWDMAKLKQALVDNNLDPVSHYMIHGKNEGLGTSFLNQGSTGQNYALSAGEDLIVSTNGNDYFYAKLGELNTSDEIYDIGGVDTLKALIGVSDNDIAIQPTIVNVERIIFQAQNQYDGGGSNTVSGRDVAVDAGEIKGMTFLQNTDSRADLVVEDVRTDSDQMTISWKNSDPGLNVDFEVYFNPQNLTTEGASASGALTIQLMDVVAAATTATANSPLLNQPWDIFKFTWTDINGNTRDVELKLESAKVTGANATYETLVEAIEAAIALEDPTGAMGLTVDLGSDFTASTYVSTSGRTYTATGSNVVISSSTGQLEATGWGTQSGTIPPLSGIVSNASGSGDVSCPLIVTDIHLDNVGRVKWDDNYDCLPDDEYFGSEAGNMIVGSMADRGGIERFNVAVESSSWLSSLASTNNTLRMIKVQSGSKGNLFIGVQEDDNASGGQDALWGPSSWTDKAFLLSTNGVVDVKQFDATALDGTANIGASITEASFAKYLKDVDGTAVITEDYAPDGSFNYLFGDKMDILNMTVNSGIAADNDFILNVNMGGGNDFVNFFLHNTDAAGAEAPVTDRQIITSNNLRNVVINGGAGDDTVTLWGRTAVTVNGDEGNDLIRVSQLEDDTDGATIGAEQNAVWIFNANSVTDRGIISTDQGAQPQHNDILSTTDSVAYTAATTSTNTLYLSVTFKGVTSKVVSVRVDQNAGNTGGTIDAAVLNRAIAAAINEDSVLSGLLVAKDGAGYSLLVESLIDGIMTEADLSIGLWTNTAGTTAVGSWDTGNYYDTAFATDGNGDGFFAPAANSAFTAATTTLHSQFSVTEGTAGHFSAPGLTAGQTMSFEIDGVTYSGTAAAAISTLGDLATAVAALTDGSGNTLGSVFNVTTSSTDTLVFTFVDGFDHSLGGGTISADYTLNANSGTNAALPVAAPTGNAATWTLDAGFGDPTDMVDGDYLVTIGSQTFTFTVSTGVGLADDTALISSLLGATLVGGTTETLNDFFDLANSGPVNDSVLTVTSLNFATTAFPSIPAVTVEVVTTAAGAEVVGKDTGTDSLNRVWGGAGDDVIVLNAGSDADWFDVVEFHNTAAGSEGNDVIFNFERGADKIDLTSYGDATRVSGTYTGAVAIGDLTATNVLSLVQAGGFFQTGTANAALTGAQLIQYGAGGNEYVLVYVNNTVGNSTIEAGEITIVGTVTLADTLNGDATGTLSDTDLV